MDETAGGLVRDAAGLSTLRRLLASEEVVGSRCGIVGSAGADERTEKVMRLVSRQNQTAWYAMNK